MDYKKAYYLLFNAQTDAVKLLQQSQIKTAIKLLQDSQLKTEDMYINNLDTSKKDDK